MRTDISKTELNLWTAFMDEAKTHRLYSAYALKAMSEGYPQVAEAFMQAAGDEIVHALLHLRALGAVKSTVENLRQVVKHEAAETQTTYPRYIADARAEGRADALEGFEVAMAREAAHVKLFEDALALVEQEDVGRRSSAAPDFFGAVNSTAAAPALDGRRTARGVEKMSGPAEVTQERERVASRTRIREFVFGAQDGLLTTVSVVSAFFGAHESNTTILLAGVATGVAGMVAMTAGQYLSSKAESEVHRSEIEREMREIIDNPAEELAELAEIYRLQGMAPEQARDAALAVSKDPKKALEVMARAELGLDTQATGSPLRTPRSWRRRSCSAPSRRFCHMSSPMALWRWVFPSHWRVLRCSASASSRRASPMGTRGAPAWNNSSSAPGPASSAMWSGLSCPACSA